MPPKKNATSFRLSDEGDRLLHTISRSLGISQAATIEMALRILAKSLGIADTGERSGPSGNSTRTEP